MPKAISCQTYKIHFENQGQILNDLVNEKSYSQVFVLVDENTKQHCLAKLKSQIDFSVTEIMIQSGEIHKSLDTCQIIWNQLITQGADRHALLINLGGGVIGDMGGFCASTFMRGIEFVQIPTTLLSMVDASVGSKLGVDFQNYKNIIGIFNEPEAILIDTSFLVTLPFRELRSGYAEVLKHALIRDADLWHQLSKISELNQLDWDEIVYRNVGIKKSVVDEDPFEKGLRKILNFGHTIGHAVETHHLVSDHVLLHGEAIAIGMIAEAKLGHNQGMIDHKTLELISTTIFNIYDGLPSQIVNKDMVWTSMGKDKKNKGGKVLGSLINKIGACSFNIPLEEDSVLAALDYYEQERSR